LNPPFPPSQFSKFLPNHSVKQLRVQDTSIPIIINPKSEHTPKPRASSKYHLQIQTIQDVRIAMSLESNTCEDLGLEWSSFLNRTFRVVNPDDGSVTRPEEDSEQRQEALHQNSEDAKVVSETSSVDSCTLPIFCDILHESPTSMSPQSSPSISSGGSFPEFPEDIRAGQVRFINGQVNIGDFDSISSSQSKVSLRSPDILLKILRPDLTHDSGEDASEENDSDCEPNPLNVTKALRVSKKPSEAVHFEPRQFEQLYSANNFGKSESQAEHDPLFSLVNKIDEHLSDYDNNANLTFEDEIDGSNDLFKNTSAHLVEEEQEMLEESPASPVTEAVLREDDTEDPVDDQPISPLQDNEKGGQSRQSTIENNAGESAATSETEDQMQDRPEAPDGAPRAGLAVWEGLARPLRTPGVFPQKLIKADEEYPQPNEDADSAGYPNVPKYDDNGNIPQACAAKHLLSRASQQRKILKVDSRNTVADRWASRNETSIRTRGREPYFEHEPVEPSKLAIPLWVQDLLETRYEKKLEEQLKRHEQRHRMELAEAKADNEDAQDATRETIDQIEADFNKAIRDNVEAKEALKESRTEVRRCEELCAELQAEQVVLNEKLRSVEVNREEPVETGDYVENLAKHHAELDLKTKELHLANCEAEKWRRKLVVEEYNSQLATRNEQHLLEQVMKLYHEKEEQSAMNQTLYGQFNDLVVKMSEREQEFQAIENELKEKLAQAQRQGGIGNREELGPFHFAFLPGPATEPGLLSLRPPKKWDDEYPNDFEYVDLAGHKVYGYQARYEKTCRMLWDKGVAMSAIQQANNALKGEVADGNSKLAARQHEINNLQHKLEAQTDKSQRLDTMATELATTLKEVISEGNKMRFEIKERDHDIEALVTKSEVTIMNTKGELDIFKATLAEKEKIIQDHEAEIIAQEQQLVNQHEHRIAEEKNRNTEIIAMKSRIETLENDYEEASTIIADTNSRHKKRTEHDEKQIKECNEIIRRLEEERENLEMHREESLAIVADMDGRRQKKAEDDKKQTKKYNEKMKPLEQERDELRRVIANLPSTDSFQAQVPADKIREAFEKQIREKHDEIDELKQKLFVVNTQLQVQVKEIEDYEKHFQETRDEVGFLEGDVDAFIALSKGNKVQSLARHQETTDELVTKAGHLEADQTATKNTDMHSKAELDIAKNQLDHAKDENKVLIDRIAKLEKKAQKANEEYVANVAHIQTRTKQELETRQREIGALRKECDDVKQQLQSQPDGVAGSEDSQPALNHDSNSDSEASEDSNIDSDPRNAQVDTEAYREADKPEKPKKRGKLSEHAAEPEEYQEEEQQSKYDEVRQEDKPSSHADKPEEVHEESKSAEESKSEEEPRHGKERNPEQSDEPEDVPESSEFKLLHVSQTELKSSQVPSKQKISNFIELSLQDDEHKASPAPVQKKVTSSISDFIPLQSNGSDESYEGPECDGAGIIAVTPTFGPVQQPTTKGWLSRVKSAVFSSTSRLTKPAPRQLAPLIPDREYMAIHDPDFLRIHESDREGVRNNVWNGVENPVEAFKKNGTGQYQLKPESVTRKPAQKPDPQPEDWTKQYKMGR
jgi:chromosome segregation ATPase